MVLNRRKTVSADGDDAGFDGNEVDQQHLTQREKHERYAQETRSLHAASAEHRHSNTYDEKISIGKIRPETKESNSRTRFVIYEAPLTNPFEKGDARYKEAQDTIDDIKRLAGSIKESGLLNDIEVYTSGSQYHIVHGHKRYFALKFLYGDNHAINCKVHRTRPKDLMIRRFAENSARSDLSLQAELLQFEKTLDDLSEVYPDKNLTIRFVAEVLALRKSKVGVYIKVLRKMPEVKEKVLNYEIKKFRQLQTTTMDDAARTQVRRSPGNRHSTTRAYDLEGGHNPPLDDSPGFLLDISAEHLIALVENHFPDIPVDSYRNQPVLLANALSSHIKKRYEVAEAADASTTQSQ